MVQYSYTKTWRERPSFFFAEVAAFPPLINEREQLGQLGREETERVERRGGCREIGAKQPMPTIFSLLSQSWKWKIGADLVVVENTQKAFSQLWSTSNGKCVNTLSLGRVCLAASLARR